MQQADLHKDLVNAIAKIPPDYFCEDLLAYAKIGGITLQHLSLALERLRAIEQAVSPLLVYAKHDDEFIEACRDFMGHVVPMKDALTSQMKKMPNVKQKVFELLFSTIVVMKTRREKVLEHRLAS